MCTILLVRALKFRLLSVAEELKEREIVKSANTFIQLISMFRGSSKQS